LKNCVSSYPKIKKHPFKIIAFDWDGTAVANRQVDAGPVADVLEELLKFGVYIVVITGTNFGNVDRQFSSLIKGPHKRNLFICTDRGSEVYGFDENSEPVLIFGRKATDEEEMLLSKAAEAVKHEIESRSNITIDIVYKRLNRRKIDLIPEWENPPKSQIGELLEKTEARLREGGYSDGIKGAFDLTARLARETGLPDARLTSDVKHVELGLTDKSDSIKWVLSELSRKQNIPYTDIVVLGDEFGPIAGFEGSDFLTYLPEAAGIDYVSVGKEPSGVPDGVIHVGGGPDCFVDLMKEQASIYRTFAQTEDPTFLIVEEGFDPIREREKESVLTIGNGYLGVRGSLEERVQGSEPATLVAGVYDREKEGEIEELVVAPDWLHTRIHVEGDELRFDKGRILEHRRTLDMKKGILRREWRHHDERGRITLVKFLRFASLADPHALVLKISVSPENYQGEIRVETGIEHCQKMALSAIPVGKREIEGGKGVVTVSKTEHTGIMIAQAQRSRVAAGIVKPDCRTYVNECGVSENLRWQADVGQVIEIEKIVSIYTSRDTDDPERDAVKSVMELSARGVNELLLEHIDAWQKRWHVAAIGIDCDAEAQKWLNFAGYHLIIAGNHHDERVSISARTLTGTIYKGHVFWDADMFMLPFFIYTHPPTARAMLMYRYHTLPGARKEAQEMGLKGALYAWESTVTGEEMTPEFVITPTGEVILILTGKMEQHINTSVAYGVWTYWVATRDDQFFANAGAEILIEAARFWVSRAEEKDGVYHIYNVCGPDEYHEIVDDSIYTNLKAVWSIHRAADAVAYLKEEHPERWSKLKETIGFDERELMEWDHVAGKMYKDMNHGNNLIEQFAGYFALKDIDVNDYEPRTAPLDMILGREETTTTQLVKQADVVMLLYLLEDQFSQEVIEENFVYYDRRTGHGSSLSPSMYGLVSARLGKETLARRYFRQAGTIDLANNMGNAAGGVHAAALGGLWQQAIMGFAGMRISRDGIYVYPRLLSEWSRLRFNLMVHGTLLEFDIERDHEMTVNIGREAAVKVGVFGGDLQTLQPGVTYRSHWDGSAWREFQEIEEGEA
jgi:kojibiose phosphorylase